MATTKTAVDRIYDALAQSQAAVVQRVKSGNERAHRITSALITEAEWAQQNALELGRAFASNPTDVAGFSTTVFQKTGEAEGRAFEFARSLLDELATASRETRTAVEQSAQAGLAAGWPVIEAARDFATRTGKALRPEFLQDAAARPAPRATRRTTEEAA